MSYRPIRVWRGGKRYLEFLLRARAKSVILSGGMPRSGSTLLFNILRLSLELSDRKVVAGWVGDLSDLNAGDVFLIKVHRVNRLLAIRSDAFFYTFRDIRNALVSNQRKFGRASTDLVRQWISDYLFAEHNAKRMIKYEDMMQDLTGTIENLTEDLGLDVDSSEILRRLPDHSPGAECGGYSRESLLHVEHRTNTVSGEWRSVLSNSLQDFINENYGWWLEANGYPTD